MVCTRPLVRYHGGKWLLAPWIIEHFPKHKVYVEPFGGGGSVLLRKPRSYSEVYNDLDGEIVNLFRVVRDNGDELVRQLYMTPFSREEFIGAYTVCDDPIESARRTVIKAFQGHASNAIHRKTGFRVDSFRYGTAPSFEWSHLPDAIMFIVERMRGVAIENMEWVGIVRRHDSNETLFYIDPPYLPSTRDKGTDYAHEMTVDQHVELLEWCKSAKGYVCVSGYYSEMYTEYLAGWTVRQKNALADGARNRVEWLWMNYDPPNDRMLF